MSPDEVRSFTRAALALAAEAGFAAAGAVDPRALAAHDCAGRLRDWLAAGMHADMHYLAERAELICDPAKNFPWTRGVLCLGASYAPAQAGPPDAAGDSDSGCIARYARGRDYHKVLFKAASGVLRALQQRRPGLVGRVCVDTAPVAERSLAVLAGLGWIGRSGMLVNSIYGTRLLLCEIFFDVDLAAEGFQMRGDGLVEGLPASGDSLTPAPAFSGCGDCRACVEACPNAAIVADGVVDARRCASWATIEHRGEFDGLGIDTGRWVFGCDACTEVCPFNRSAEPPAGAMAELARPSAVASLSPAEILELTPEQWDQLTRGTALRRSGYTGLLRNAAAAKG